MHVFLNAARGSADLNMCERIIKSYKLHCGFVGCWIDPVLMANLKFFCLMGLCAFGVSASATSGEVLESPAMRVRELVARLRVHQRCAQRLFPRLSPASLSVVEQQRIFVPSLTPRRVREMHFEWHDSIYDVPGGRAPNFVAPRREYIEMVELEYGSTRSPVIVQLKTEFPLIVGGDTRVNSRWLRTPDDPEEWPRHIMLDLRRKVDAAEVATPAIRAAYITGGAVISVGQRTPLRELPDTPYDLTAARSVTYVLSGGLRLYYRLLP